MKAKNTLDNLEPYFGKQVNVYCQVGVVFNITGTLEKGTLTWYAVKVPSGEKIGFSFGDHEMIGGLLHVRIF